VNQTDVDTAIQVEPADCAPVDTVVVLELDREAASVLFPTGKKF
jgi:hypothetical protein